MDAGEIEKLAALEDRNWWYAERRHLLADSVRTLTPGTAIDIGAAGGGNTRVLTGLGWRAIALEYAEAGAGICAGRRLPVMRADATQLPVRSRSADLVVAFDILEHIVDDKGAAAEIFRVLRPGGRLQIAVPADPRLWSGHDEAVGHVRRYTRGTLTDLLLGAGFTVESMSSWNVLLRPVVAMRRSGSTESDLTPLPWIVNAGLRAIVAAERYLPVRNRSGVSLLATAHRPAAAYPGDRDGPAGGEELLCATGAAVEPADRRVSG